LRKVGVAPIPAPAVEGPLNELLDAYRRYLVGERGLAISTIPEYVRVARWFLSDRLGAGGLALEELSAADVSGFLARECPRVTVAGARNLVGRLRPLLRYLHVAARLRHTAATGMLREGASLREIAEVLRHREIDTTAIYAKVDRARLRALAQPWPGGAS
jgi:site-specific recombinase XerC